MIEGVRRDHVTGVVRTAGCVQCRAKARTRGSRELWLACEAARRTGGVRAGLHSAVRMGGVGGAGQKE